MAPDIDSRNFYFGHALKFAKNGKRLHQYFTERFEALGEHLLVVIGSRYAIFTTDSNDVRYMLSENFDNYQRSPVTRANFTEFLGDGIFTSMGETWRTLRKTAQPHFKVKNTKFNSQAMVKHAKALIEYLDGLPEGAVVDMQDYFGRFTLDAFGEVGFGVNIDSLHQNKVPFAEAFTGIQGRIIKRSRFPTFYKFFGFMDSEYNNYLNIINKFCEEIVETHRNDKDLAQRADLLSHFMADGPPSTLYGSKPTAKQCEKYYRDTVMNFMIAGRDTTAALLTWTFYLFSENRDIEEKCVEEARKHLTGVDDKDIPSAANKLTYIKQCLKESLRLFPPVSIDGRAAKSDDVLPSGHVLKKNWSLVYNAYVMGRSEKYWKNAHKFDPDRWAKDDDDHEHWAFLAFFAGAQRCLGQRLALAEASVATGLLLMKLKLNRADDKPINAIHNVILISEHGLNMTVEKRK